MGGGGIIFICLYVDDLLITGSNTRDKQCLKSEFEMTDLGRLSYFLGIEFKQVDGGLFMHQKKYIHDVLKKFNMLECNTAETPAEANLKLDNGEQESAVDGTLFRQMIGCLRFIFHTRPEISYSVGLVSRFMSNPKKSHFMAAKRILRYLCGTLDFGVLYSNHSEKVRLQLVAYSDSDWCGDLLERKSTMGYVFLLSDSPISWCSKKQAVITLSTCEAEYIAACHAACQDLWLESLLEELKVGFDGYVDLLIDNKSAINLAKNPVAHGAST